jgi:sensor domain CHASE-containing protein
MKKIKVIILATLAALAAVSVWTDYSIWRLQHPEAPTWTYLFAE